MANDEQLQGLINKVHVAFREQERSDSLLMWDNFISAIIHRNFDEGQAKAFFEAQGALLSVFADDLIAFIFDYMMNNTEGE